MNDYMEIANQYLTECETIKKLSKHTLKAYRIDLKQFIMFLKIDTGESLKENVLNYISDLNKRYKPKSVKRKMASIHAFLQYVNEEEENKNDLSFFQKIRVREDKKLPRIIGSCNIKDIYKVLYSSDNHRKLRIRDRAVIELLFSTGIRVSELCLLKIGDVNLNDCVLTIFGKGRKERSIYLGNDQVLHVLKDYKKYYRFGASEEESFFINRFGSSISDQSVRNLIKNYTLQAGIHENITPHMFRHTFATLLLEEDVDIRYIQQILGHSSILTTQIYTHISQNKQKNILINKNPRNRIEV